MDTWHHIAAERGRLVDALDGLSETDWAGPSLCAGWSNREALAHIVSTAELTAGKFFLGMARNGFNFDRMVASDIERVGADTIMRLLTRLREAIPSRAHPPGPVASMLLETVVHGEDIAVPLHRSIEHSTPALIACADFAKSAQPLVGCRKRIAGLRLRATDVDWSTGDGPEVRGPLVALLLAMCGRKAALPTLTGDGVATIKGRM